MDAAFRNIGILKEKEFYNDSKTSRSCRNAFTMPGRDSQIWEAATFTVDLPKQ